MNSLLDKQHTDPRVVKTIEALLDAFMALMQDKLYDKITVGEIADRARVNRATFYAHFENKDALLEYGLRHNFEVELSEWLPDNATLTPDNLRRLAHGLFQFLGDFLSSCHPVPNGQPPKLPLLHKQVQPVLQDVFAEWIEASGIADPLTIETQARVLSWALFGSALSWAEERDRPDVEAMIESLVDSLLPSMAH